MTKNTIVEAVLADRHPLELLKEVVAKYKETAEDRELLRRACQYLSQWIEHVVVPHSEDWWMLCRELAKVERDYFGVAPMPGLLD